MWSRINLVARILLGSIFLVSGLGKITGWEQTLAYMSANGLSPSPLLLAAVIALEVTAGLSIILGYFAKWGAGLLFLYLIPVTLIFHDFWSAPSADIQNQMIHFLKNLTIMGGLLGLVVHGSGRSSLDFKLHPRLAKSEEEMPSAPEQRKAA